MKDQITSDILQPDRAGGRESLELELDRIGFRNPARAAESLRRLLEGSPLTAPPPSGLLETIAQSADPDRALNNFERFASATFSPSIFYSFFAENRTNCSLLIKIFAGSQFLSDILVRNPTYLYWLFGDSNLLSRRIHKRQLIESFQKGLEPFQNPERKLNSLRRLVRRELLRIGTCDLDDRKSLQTVTQELSDLADVTLQIVYEMEFEEMTERFGVPRSEDGTPCKMAIISLGKLGGGELNFSSDIDIIFVYSEEGRVEEARFEKRHLTAHEFFNKLAERIVKRLSEATEEGFLYRVDTRLKPEGKSGSLTRSIASYELHYETRGETWERQMLIKARFSAGDPNVGKLFLRRVYPFIYTKHLDRSPVEEIRTIKERIEGTISSRGERETHLKLRAGGIRDIEFIVQCLQLLTGGFNPKVRCRKTLRAIDLLKKERILSEDEARDLSQAYLFFRRAEHRLQMMEARQTYEFPTNPDELTELALKMGIKPALDKSTGEILADQFNQHTARVRKIYNEIFYKDGVERKRLPIEDILGMDGSDPQVQVTLGQIGFTDPRSAHRSLISLATGRFLASHTRVEEKFLELAPNLINIISASADPGLALTNLERIVRSYGAEEILYDIFLQRGNLLDILVRLCATATHICNLVAIDPRLMEALLTSDFIEQEQAIEVLKALVASVINSQENEAEKLATLNFFKNLETLRTASRDVAGLTTMEETFARLSMIAEIVVEQAYLISGKRMAERYNRSQTKDRQDIHFACIAMGKLGGYELNFGSDLDLFFVYSNDDMTGGDQEAGDLQFFINLSREILGVLGGFSIHGTLYRVDARLRPEGKSSNLALSFGNYMKYLRERASLWERQAAIKSRFITGDHELGKSLFEAITDFVYGSGLSTEEAKSIREMRYKIEANSKKKYGARTNIKSGRGGIVDIEFVTQALQLKFARQDSSLRTPSTLKALRALANGGYLPIKRAEILIGSYTFLRMIEKALRLGNEQAKNLIPDKKDELFRLAKLVGCRNSTIFHTDLNRHLLRVRSIFEEVFKQIPL